MKKYIITEYCKYIDDLSEDDVVIPTYVVDTNLDGFFQELFKLYEKYNISISHEDEHGSFILRKNNANDREWLEEAKVCDFLGIKNAYSRPYDEED